MVSGFYCGTVMVHHSSRYQSVTIQSLNSGRYAYMPLYPNKCALPYKYLLLANVPGNPPSSLFSLFLFSCLEGARLSSREHRQRRNGVVAADARTFIENYDTSAPFSLSLLDAEDLADRVLVNSFILLFNAQRLRIFCFYFLKLYERFQRKILRPSVPWERECTLDSSQMVLLLEFYLQMDGKA
jgi:hypothetical protein